MTLVVGLLATSLFGAGGPEGPEGPMIVYELKVLEMNGLGWRSSVYSQLQPVARQGGAAVWTAPRDAANLLAEKAGRVISAPKVTSCPGVCATVFHNATRKVVTELAREADGPVNHASFVGFVPRTEDATEGYSVSVRGRKLDQGVLAEVRLEDKQITAVHTVALSENLESKGDDDPEATKRPIEVTLQVPESTRTEVAGEWLIPRDGVLVVSLGAHTVADANGKAVVRERLAVLAAQAVEAPGEAVLSAELTRVNLPGIKIVGSGRVAEAPLTLPVPVLPSRSLPVSTDGVEPASLPPLPDDGTPPTSLPGSSEPCPTPQSKASALREPIPWRKSDLRDTPLATTPPSTRLEGSVPWRKNELRDPASAPAAFRVEPGCCDAPHLVEPGCCDASHLCPAPKPADANGPTAVDGKTFWFRVPGGDGLVIEVHAKPIPLPPPPPGRD
jgi:hypothetical protein